MAFMLGSFTGGLFSGFQGTMQSAALYQGLKESWAAEDGANATYNNLTTDRVNAKSPGWEPGTGAGGQPKAQDMSSTRTDYQGPPAPEKSAPAEPPKIDLNKVPKPAFMTALPASNTPNFDAGGRTTGDGKPNTAYGYGDAGGATVGPGGARPVLPTPNTQFGDAGGATKGPGGTIPQTAGGRLRKQLGLTALPAAPPSTPTLSPTPTAPVVAAPTPPQPAVPPSPTAPSTPTQAMPTAPTAPAPTPVSSRGAATTVARAAPTQQPRSQQALLGASLLARLTGAGRA